jgi:hypothetical protein
MKSSRKILKRIVFEKKYFNSAPLNMRIQSDIMSIVGHSLPQLMLRYNFCTIFYSKKKRMSLLLSFLFNF